MSVFESIINGTYKKKDEEKETVYNSIVNGTYKTRQQEEEEKKTNNSIKSNKISSYSNLKQSALKQVGEQIESNKAKREEINNEIKKQVNTVNNNFNKSNNQNITLPTSNSSYRSKSLETAKNSNDTILKNMRLSTKEEQANSKEYKKGDLFKLTNGKIDDRSENKKKIDNVVAPIANIGMGLESVIPSISNYTDKGLKFLAKAGLRGIAQEFTDKNTAKAIGNVVGGHLYENAGRGIMLGGQASDSKKIKKEMDTEKAWRNSIIQNNMNKSTNPLSQKLTELAPSLGENLLPMAVAALPVPGARLASTAMFITSAAGNYLDDAEARGMDENQAFGYATVMGLAEGGSEALISGNMVSKVKKAITGKGLSDTFLNSLGSEISENFWQEALMEPFQEGTSAVFGGEYDTSNMIQRMGKSGMDGVISALLLKGASIGLVSSNNVIEKINNNETITENDITTVINDLKRKDYTGYQKTMQGAIEAVKEQMQKNSQLPIANQNLQQIATNTLPTAQKQTNTQQITQLKNKTAQNEMSEQIQMDSENFAKQVENVNNIKENNDLTVLSNTPEVYKQIGLNDLPMTITKNHTIWAMTEKTDNNSHLHGLSEEILKQVPEALTRPLNIVQSGSKRGSIVSITELSDSEGNLVIVPIKVNGKANVNEIEIDSNVLTSIYGKDSDYDTWMRKNVKNNRVLYDIDEGIIKKYRDNPPRLQLSNDIISNVDTNNNVSTYNNSIAQNENFVNTITNKSMQNNENNTQNQAPTTKNNVLPTAKKQTNTQKTQQETRLNELKSIDISEMGLLERSKIKTEIKALEEGYNNVEEYQQAEKNKKEQALQEAQQEKENKINEQNRQQQLKQQQLEKEIQDAIPLKREQYNIIQENNPMNDDIHTGVRTPSDIKTFEETINDEDSFSWGDFSKEDAKKAIENGEITVYSSYPINQGTFVSTSKIQAEEYAGGKGNIVYEKTIPLNEVAWINGDEGQYAKTNINPNNENNTQNQAPTAKNNVAPKAQKQNNNFGLDTFSNTKKYIETNMMTPTREYFQNKEIVDSLSTEDYEVLNKIYEKEGKTQILTEKKKAKLLEKYINDKYTIKDSLDILAQKFINKGHYIDQLAKKNNNPELKFMYDKNLNSFAEGQYEIVVAQTDNSGKKIGKSINEIWEPVEKNKLTKEFSEYLLHKHNIDRSEHKKYIFGEEIGPTESTTKVLELEKKYPEFKQYAKDINEFNHNNLMSLKESGMLTEDTIKYIESMYPNYIAISRNLEDSIYNGSKDKTGTNNALKKATGGNSDIQPIKDTMAQQVIRIKKLINQNELGKELAKTLKNAKVNENVDVELSPTLLLEMDTMVDTDPSGNKYYIYFEGGKQQKLKINDNLYESLRPSEINRLEKTLPIKALQKITSIHRSLLTSSNPIFIITNFFKDFQDGAFNSKYSSKFIKNYGKALNEIYTKGKYYESYMANGGMTNTYFDYNKGISKKSNKFVEKIKSTNEIVEQLPRLAEFISTIEDGKSLNEALYNSAEITTNFKRGGDITKAFNRNGVNFLNASIQGLDKQFRNFSGQNGVRGYVNLLAKATIMGIAPAILNHMLLDDDDDYKDLPDSTKDLYYLFKYDNGKFIRIPKGRVLSIFGATARRTLETIQGQEDAWEGFGQSAINQVAPNNPLEDNILSPIIQVKNNKTWYGGDLVSSRLQKELPKNQYDETTDNFSKWLGDKINVSPKKINYVLDQYSGGIGDVVLPIITPQAKQNVIMDKFTTDSILKNKNVGKFYDTLEEQTQIVNDPLSTDEDKIKLKYLNSISKDMGDLYKEKREIQMSDISNKEKTQKVREVQQKINILAEKALSNYKNGSIENDSATIDNNEYYKDSKGEWTVLSDEEKEKNDNISIETYSDYKNKIYSEKQKKVETGELTKKQDLKDKDKINILITSNYSNKEKQAIYENYIISSKDKKYDVIKDTGLNIDSYLKYKLAESNGQFDSDKKDDGTEKGKTITNSAKNKRYNYIINMKGTSYIQKTILFGLEYEPSNTDKKTIINYINNMQGKTWTEKKEILHNFSWITWNKNGTYKY